MPLAPQQRHAIPVVSLGGEPYLGAWLKEGDMVEANFNGDSSGTFRSCVRLSFWGARDSRTCCLFHAEWYRGVAIYASANRLLWDVEYDDGDLQEDLPPSAVRPYVPYQVDEIIEVRVDEETFARGHVVAMNSQDDTFDIELEESSELYASVHPMDIRRRVGEDQRRQLVVGDRVHAQYPGADGYYPGTITKVHPNGSVSAQYDDGDYFENLSPRMVDLINK